MEQLILRPDAKGRVNLGDLAKGVSSYRVNISEKWIFENEDALEKVKQHISLATKQDE